ncbi:GNAT family protein [Variovorax sp. J22R133]|uniref:GNAT family N-acetyltransferase n=1 Tax=Variovorax brevis TaxID=3053503 RepID=UPI0025760E3F|nr:GNAT family protein [Variovorax sp. J22R133]MDM0116489.1 GNAT family protein [Variovorax sp. J22R133]
MTGQRNATQAGACYDMDFGGARTVGVVFGWPQHIDAALEPRIIELMRVTTASAPIIGFAQEISDAEAQQYLHELKANLGAGKCRLLTIVTDDGTVIGLCTLRRNLNPNNCHITDLAKGMILERYRGGLVLPAAFLEIALKCEADGVDVLTLDVRDATPAHRAWERFGFQTYGTLPDYARAQGKTHAGHFMMQRVSDLKARALQTLRASATARA